MGKNRLPGFLEKISLGADEQVGLFNNDLKLNEVTVFDQIPVSPLDVNQMAVSPPLLFPNYNRSIQRVNRPKDLYGPFSTPSKGPPV